MATKRKSTTSAARIAARVRKAQAEMRAAANRYNKAAAEAAAPGPMFGPFIPQELLARRRADSVLARALRKRSGKKTSKKRRSGKKKASAAQRAARARFARAAKARSKAGKRRSSSSSKKRSSKRKVGQTVTAAQVIAMAKKGALQRWLCQGTKRTGCGSTGRVVSGKGRFSRVR